MTIGISSKKEEAVAEVTTINAFETAVMRVSCGALLTLSLCAGLWASASLVGGLVVAGGAISLGKAWFVAVLGV